MCVCFYYGLFLFSLRRGRCLLFFVFFPPLFRLLFLCLTLFLYNNFMVIIFIYIVLSRIQGKEFTPLNSRVLFRFCCNSLSFYDRLSCTQWWIWNNFYNGKQCVCVRVCICIHMKYARKKIPSRKTKSVRTARSIYQIYNSIYEHEECDRSSNDHKLSIWKFHFFFLI